MPAPTYTVPTANADTSTEEPKLITALAELKSILNGDVDADNLANEAVTLAKLAASIQQALIPVGSVVPYAGASAPTGFVLADGTNPGSGASGQPYEALYGVIGNTFGGTTAANFLTPNLKGRIPVGRDASIGGFDTRGEIGGEATVALTTAQLPAHSHSVNDPGHAHDLNYKLSAGVAGGGGILNLATGNRTAEPPGDSFNEGDAVVSGGTGISIANSGGGESHTNCQPYLVVNYIIKF
jgi:microcystin-dependent protein